MTYMARRRRQQFTDPGLPARAPRPADPVPPAPIDGARPAARAPSSGKSTGGRSGRARAGESSESGRDGRPADPIPAGDRESSNTGAPARERLPGGQKKGPAHGRPSKAPGQKTDRLGADSHGRAVTGFAARGAVPRGNIGAVVEVDQPQFTADRFAKPRGQAHLHIEPVALRTAPARGSSADPCGPAHGATARPISPTTWCRRNEPGGSSAANRSRAAASSGAPFELVARHCMATWPPAP